MEMGAFGSGETSLQPSGTLGGRGATFTRLIAMG